MRQKKKDEGGSDKPEACLKCAKLQNGGHSSLADDSDNPKSAIGTLKSVLKRAPSHKKPKDKTTKRQKNHVTFDESQNKYFDADYVILIHEEEYDYDDYYDEGSPYDDEDDDLYDDEIGHKMCCSNPNCSNLISMGYYPEQAYRYDFGRSYYDYSEGQGEKCGGCDEEFVPEFVVGGAYSDHVTLSPPEGYKDGGCPHHGGAAFPDVPNQENEEKKDVSNGHPDEPKEKPEDTVKQRFIVETITMTTVTERRIVTDEKKMGILKGGKLWKNPEKSVERSVNYNEVVDYKENEPEVEEVSTSFTQSEEGNGNEDKKPKEEEKKEETVSPESTELTLTFKLGQHVLVANSLKPNSAVRQLFPSPRFLSPPPQDEEENLETPPKQFLVTAESLRMFEEAKKNNINEKEEFISIMPEEGKRVRRIIEGNTLRRSLIRYPCDLRSKRLAEKKKKEHSLEERIKQLTCNIDEDLPPQEEVREEPQGEEAVEKLALPTESPTPSTNSSSSSGTYKKIPEPFQRPMEDVNCNINQEVPDNFQGKALSRVGGSAEARKQFLSTLGPLTACVGNLDGKEYSIEDINAVLKGQESRLGAQPDIIAGTPQTETPGDELALFAQQEANRTDKIKKRYSTDDKSDDDDDDYGFNKRPTVKGIKPRFGTTQEIVQQIQEGATMWPYYSQNQPPRSNLLYRSPSVYSSNSSLYQPVRINSSSGNYAELSNFHFRHPPQSPPPARHRMSAPPDASAAIPRQTNGVVRNPDSMFYRRTVPNVQNPSVQMQFTPVDYPVPSIRFSATCAPQPIVDESRIIIEPHYSTLPRPAIIRVGQGQQMIRVPVPYSAGAPVQVHLMTRRCDSPQRPNSPQYLIAKGTQTNQQLPDGVEEKVNFEAQGKAIAEELRSRKLSRSLSQDGGGVNFQRPLGGRGVPEGAASCAAQDSQIADPVTGNTVYYSMNV